MKQTIAYRDSKISQSLLFPLDKFMKVLLGQKASDEPDDGTTLRHCLEKDGFAVSSPFYLLAWKVKIIKTLLKETECPSLHLRQQLVFRRGGI